MFYINNMTQMSCNFREQSKIVRTGGIPLWGEGPEPSQATLIASPLPHPPVNRRVFLSGFPRGEPEFAEFIHHGNPPFWAANFRGEGGVICRLI
jgi:hypothetical protein